MSDCHICGKPTTDLTDLAHVGDHHLRCEHCGAESAVTEVSSEASRLRAILRDAIGEAGGYAQLARTATEADPDLE